MKRLLPYELSTLRYVRDRRRVCIGDVVDEADALLAETMARLAKKRFLTAAATDDGPAYTLAPSGIKILEVWND